MDDELIAFGGATTPIAQSLTDRITITLRVHSVALCHRIEWWGNIKRQRAASSG